MPRAKRALDVAASGAVLVLLAVWVGVAVAAGIGMVRCPADRGRLLYRERRDVGILRRTVATMRRGEGLRF